MLEDRIKLLALCRIKNVSWYLIAREARRHGGLPRLLSGGVVEKSASASKSLEALRSSLPELPRHQDEVRLILDQARSRGYQLSTVLDADYPINLRAIYNLPPFLFYRGALQREADTRSVAVVGTRKASDDGLTRARAMARRLAEHGVTVVSGLARGIDTAAHTETLRVGGRTIAVLGSGLDRIYPPENEELANRILEDGALISQFWPDSPPTTYSFPRRNITMSGLGQGTVVIEASATSGAKLQARLALEHGKKVFLIKSLVTHQKWAREYLDRGAIEVADVDTIVGRLASFEQLEMRDEDATQLALGLDEPIDVAE